MADGHALLGWGHLEKSAERWAASLKTCRASGAKAPRRGDLENRKRIAQTADRVKNENESRRSGDPTRDAPADHDPLPLPEDLDPSRRIASRSFVCRRIKRR